MTPDGRKLETARITNSPAELRRAIAGAGTHPKLVLGATYGCYWVVDTLVAAGIGPLTAISRTGGTAPDSSVRPGLLMDLDLWIWMQADRQDVLH